MAEAPMSPELLVFTMLCASASTYFLGGVDARLDFVSSLGPLLRMLDAETAHVVGIQVAAKGLFPRDDRPDPPSLRTRVWGMDFRNPIGLSAGFDKDGEAIEGLMGFGFGFVEIGSVTPQPQPGNPQPRAFRLREHRAVINRYGFNSLGADAVRANLDAFAAKAKAAPEAKPALLGVNLGKNKESEDAAADYCYGLERLSQHADYLVVNVSSPNTPGLRSLQGRQELESLVERVKAARDAVDWAAVAGRSRGPPPLLVKIAPDLRDEDKADIAAVAQALAVDGLIVGNTTVSRPGAVAGHPSGCEAGGLSGAPLFPLSTAVLADMYRLTGGAVPLVGCGGVGSGEDAYRKIRAGASLVQLYTAMAYDGPALIPRVKRELAACLARDGFASVADAVGADVPEVARKAVSVA